MAFYGLRRITVAKRTIPSSLAIPCALLATLSVALAQGRKPFYYDSGAYWQLGSTFFEHGHFSLLNFYSPLRGYLWPLAAHFLHVFAHAIQINDSLAVRVVNAALLSAIGLVLAPKLAEVIWPQRPWGPWRRAALTGLILVFWNGYLAFPLTDLPALALVFLALIALTKVQSPIWAIVAGASCAGAINLRPSYLLLAPTMAVLLGWTWWRGRGAAGRASLAQMALIGTLLVVSFAAVSAPQSLSSHRHFGTWSFVPGTAAHLTTFQLTEGLQLQRYETYVGPGHPPKMLYLDGPGEKLLAEQKGHAITSTGQYMELLADHPLTLGELFVRHVINGFDQRYSTPYVASLAGRSASWLRVGSLTIAFLALLRLLWATARRSLGEMRWRYPIALLLCCLTAIPSAIETRYLLPAYLLSYLLVLAPGWRGALESHRAGARYARGSATIVAAYAAFMAIVFYIANGASSNLHLA